MAKHLFFTGWFHRRDTRFGRDAGTRHHGNVLFIVENNTVPPDIRVWREAKALRQAGFSTAVIAPKGGGFTKQYEVIDDIEIYRHPSFDHKGGIAGQLLEYANALLWELFLSIRLYIKRPFHIIHAANPPDHIFLIALLFRMFRVRFIFDHHDLAPELYCSKYGGEKKTIYHVLSLMEKCSCLVADAVISTNRSYRKHIIDRHRIDPKKIFIVRNDPEGPGPAGSATFTQDKNGRPDELLYVGSINSQDGVDLLVRVVHILVHGLKRERVHCTVVGDGDGLSRARALCSEMNMGRHIDFTGYVYDRRAVRDFIDNADICLETAPDNEVNRRSTFIKIMEYMSAGKPIVAFDLDETRWSAGESALLIEQGDLGSFAGAIGKLIDEPALREKLGKAGQRRIRDALNWEKASQALMRAYDYVSGK